VQQQAAPSKLTVYRSFYKLLHFCVNEWNNVLHTDMLKV
jgi:hypothetical protein